MTVLNTRLRLSAALLLLPVFLQTLYCGAETVDNHYREALQHYNRQHYAQAMQVLSKAADEDPQHALVHTLLGHAAFELELADEAVAAYARGLELGRFESAALARLAHLEIRRGRTASALAALNLLRLVAPENIDALLVAAELHAQTGNTGAAELLYNEVIEFHPEDVTAYLRLANIHMQRHEWQPAITLLTAAVHLGHETAEQARTIADLHMRAGNPAVAAQWYRRTVTLGVDDAATRLHLAHALYDAGQLKGAQLAADDLAGGGHEPEIIQQASLLLGRIERDGDNPELALEHWRKAAADENAPLQIHEYLATHAFTAGTYAEAARHFQAALKAGGGSRSVYRGLVVSCLHIDERSAARDALSLYIAHFGLDREAQQLVRQFVQTEE